MRLPSLKIDSWELRSAEQSHLKHPDTFWTPPLKERQTLKRGQAAKVIFDIEGQDEYGNVSIRGEKMWVVVAEKENDFYIGILDNKPASIEPSDDNYLCFGAEIPFLAEHISDIAEPPPEYSQWQLGQPPERKWPRD